MSTPSVWNCLTTGRLPMSGSFLGIAIDVGGGAQLLHDGHRGERVVPGRRLSPS